MVLSDLPDDDGKGDDESDSTSELEAVPAPLGGEQTQDEHSDVDLFEISQLDTQDIKARRKQKEQQKEQKKKEEVKKKLESSDEDPNEIALSVSEEEEV